MMDVFLAKRLVKMELNRAGVRFGRLSARTVSFVDLARDRCVFVKVHNWIPPDGYGWIDLKMFAKHYGFCVE